jgi:putative transcriptional regulator
MTTTQRSRLANELMEMADAQRRLGIMDKAEHEKITARHLGAAALPTAKPITAQQVRQVRAKAHLSQAALGASRT